MVGGGDRKGECPAEADTQNLDLTRKESGGQTSLQLWRWLRLMFQLNQVRARPLTWMPIFAEVFIVFNKECLPEEVPGLIRECFYRGLSVWFRKVRVFMVTSS